jgi:hypothetical protein
MKYKRYFSYNYDEDNLEIGHCVYEVCDLLQKLEVMKFDQLLLEREWMYGLTLYVQIHKQHYPGLE